MPTVEVDFIYHREYLEVAGAWLTFAESPDGTFLFPIGPSCRAMGIDAPSQLAVIRLDSRLAPGLCEVRLPFGTGKEGQWSNFQTTYCLPRREYAWWLALIDPNNVKESARPGLEARQRALMDICDRMMFHQQEGAIAEATRYVAAPPERVATARGEIFMNCLRCGAPHCISMKGGEVHVYLGQED